LEEGANGGQAKVATAAAIVSMFLQLIEKGSDERGIEIFQGELAWHFFQLSLCEEQEQTEGITVGSDGMRTGMALSHQAICEEGLEKRR
jgi:hypothetical protein